VGDDDDFFGDLNRRLHEQDKSNCGDQYPELAYLKGWYTKGSACLLDQMLKKKEARL
jgi:hypothetical protein